MGYIKHHAIVVTSFDDALAKEAHKKAEKLGNTTTEVVESPVNGYYSFLIVPDGSKEGWPESDEGDVSRQRFIAWAIQQRYDDGSSALDVVEVMYDEENRTGVERI